MKKTKEQDLLPIRRMLLGVSGSLGIVSMAGTLVWLQSLLRNVEIRTVLTPGASALIPPSTFAALTRQPSVCQWTDVGSGFIPHVELTEWAELFVVMPATANVIGKAAHGIADDLLTTCVLAASCPIVFVPSMNATMWKKPVVRRNVALLRKSGMWVIDPVKGLAASTGKVGVGSMPPVKSVIESLGSILTKERARLK